MIRALPFASQRFHYACHYLVSCALGVLVVGCIRESVPPAGSATFAPASGVQVGTMAADFELPSLGGGSIHLSDCRGHAVVLNFWASWCGPCAKEMPALQALYTSESGNAPVVLGLTFPVVFDADRKLTLQYHVIGLPASIWIDANGLIVDRVAGAMDPDVLKEKAARALGNPKEDAAQAHSLRELASPNDRQRAVALMDGQLLVSDQDHEHRADLLLALEQLDSGLVLDPSRVADAGEIDQRRKLACRNLIDEALLVDAATAAGFQPNPVAVKAEIQRVMDRAGGGEALERVSCRPTAYRSATYATCFSAGRSRSSTARSAYCPLKRSDRLKTRFMPGSMRSEPLVTFRLWTALAAERPR